MLTEQQKTNFTTIFRSWLNQEQGVQNTRFTVLRDLLTEDLQAVLYKQMVTDLFIQADVAFTQLSQQKTALETEKNSIVVKGK